MTSKFQHLLGTDALGITTIGLLSRSLAPAPYANYDNSLRYFCAEEKLPPLQATPLQ
jgi:hypothetical protein